MQPLRIVIDSREQTPWAWDSNDAVTEIRTLVTGDYALAEDCEEMKGRKSLAVRFSIERKSLDDFIGTISVGWERFKRELVRMESFPFRVIIVEGDYADVCFSDSGDGIIPPEHNHPMMRPAFVGRRIAELTSCGISVLLAGNPQLAAGLAFRVFRRRADHGID